MKNNTYICYFDLLGTQALVKTSPRAYIETINKFAQRILIAIQFHKDIQAYVFSDSVYLESERLDSLCDFMSKLRSDLISEEIFFNAAICKGSLGIKKTEHSRLGYFFDGQDAVKVYREQTSFSGIGVHISNELASQLKHEVVKSTFISLSQKQGFEFKDFYDLKYSEYMQEEFDKVLSAFMNTYLNNQRASRYYFSIICTMLKSILLDGGDITQQIEGCVKALRTIDDSELRIAMSLKLFEIACQINESDELDFAVDEIITEIQPIFDLFWNNKCFSGLRELSKYDKQVILPFLRNPLSFLVIEKLSEEPIKKNDNTLKDRQT